MMRQRGPEDRIPDWRKRPVAFALWVLFAGPLRSGSVCLNSFPRFISGLRAGC